MASFSKDHGPAARPSTTSTSPTRSTSPASGRPGPWWPAGPRRSWRRSSRTPPGSRSTTSTPSSSTSWPRGRPSGWRGRASTSWRRSPINPEAPLRPLPGADDQRLEIQRESAELGLVEAEEQYKADLRALGAGARDVRRAQAERLELAGRSPNPPRPPSSASPLLRLALVQPPRPGRLPPGRQAGRGRRRPGHRQPLSRHLRPLSALHVPGRPLPPGPRAPRPGESACRSP